MNKIVVQLAERKWTARAIHFACSMARSTGGEIVLLRLIAVNNPALLGAGFDDVSEGRNDYPRISEYASVAAAYGVDLSVQPMEYVTRDDALAQAVEALDASILFAPVAQSRFALLRKFQTWNLAHRLNGCRLYTLAQSDNDLPAPSITMERAREAHA